MMTSSCPGFLDQYGIWNNGFDCASPRICCGTETDRFCCLPSVSSSTSTSTLVNPSAPDLDLKNSNELLADRWILLQLCLFALFLAITTLVIVIIYQCLTSIRREKIREKKISTSVQIPLPAASPLLAESQRYISNRRISTISSTPSDTKSRCTETSLVFNAPLNVYPTSNNHSSSSTYFVYPNDYEQLCK